MKKSLPSLLKDILQRKATAYWINLAKTRVNSWMSRFLEGGSERYSVLSSFTSSVSFDENNSTLDVNINIKPLRAIERINVLISVS